MQPKRLILQNVLQHTDLDYEFKTGITGIVGRNGSGKSNFLEAMHFAITGQTSSDYNKSDLLSWGADRGHTVFIFMHNGAEYVLTRNIHSALVKLESAALEKPLKAAEANAFMESVLGMDFKDFYENCWTPQGTLISILTCTHAARVAYFQRLAHTREAETIRGIIQENGLNKLPTFLDRTLEIQEITQEIYGLRSQVSSLEAAGAELDNLYTQYQEQLTGVQKILALPSQYQHDTQVRQAEAEVIRTRGVLESLQQKSNLTPVPEAPPVSPEMEQAKRNSEQRTYLQNQLTSLEANGAQLQGRMPTVIVEDPEPLRAALEESNRGILASKPRYDLAQNRTCPTCNRPYEFEGGEQAREKVISDYRASQTQYNQRHAEYTQKKQAFDQYVHSTRSTQALIDANNAQVQSIQAQLNQVPDTPFDAQVYQQICTAHQAYVTYLQEKQGKEAQLRSAQQSLDTATAELERIRQLPFADEATAAKAREFMANYEEIQNRRRISAGEISGAKSRAHALEQQQVRLQKEQDKRGEVSHVRNLFERAREKLHRDVLPKLVMQKMLYGLNALLDQYLSVFETNFMAHIDENFDFLCSFATKSDVPARALSGGQKVALALAFKFAVSDLTSSSVSFLVMDEPTVWLDDINKPRLAEVITKARESLEKGGYFFLATHDSILRPACSRTFDVSE